eukprot:TRINITY_DN3511_c0_g1_i3.p1 TRINITY_DN3511_c0_g1~~TRINITY_DN3511_c0_g1_i3.p1  ORF type:complete len:233 (+),score=33.73 TRINITY_DN3511_c0_g1_i3:75-773(+)
MRLGGRIVLVTGSSKGIGLELCKQFASAGSKIIAVARSAPEEMSAIPNMQVVKADISQELGIAHVVSEVAEQPIDILVHNAGIYPSDSIADVSHEKFMQAFNLNTVAPFVLTSRLLNNLRVGSKIIFISSRMGSISDNSSGGSYAYRMSKAALNMGATSLAIDLSKKGVLVGLLHPGLVETEMTKRFNVQAGQGDCLSASTSANKIYQEIENLSSDTSGVFIHAISGKRLPW